MVEPRSAKPVGRDVSPGGDTGPVQVTASALSQLSNPPHSTLHAEPRARRPWPPLPTTLPVVPAKGSVGAAPPADPSVELDAPPYGTVPATGAFPTATNPAPNEVTSRRLTPASAAAA